jgi:hypothetical protein
MDRAVAASSAALSFLYTASSIGHAGGYVLRRNKRNGGWSAIRSTRSGAAFSSPPGPRWHCQWRADAGRPNAMVVVGYGSHMPPWMGGWWHEQRSANASRPLAPGAARKRLQSPRRGLPLMAAQNASSGLPTGSGMGWPPGVWALEAVVLDLIVIRQFRVFDNQLVPQDQLTTAARSARCGHGSAGMVR